jgi:uncharacterized protein
MPTLTILYCLGIGCITGCIAALCGVGGGVIMVPCFVMLLGLGQKHAVATSLMAMIGTAIIASLQNTKNGLGDWKLAGVTMLGAMLTSYFAADWLTKIKDERLTQLFGLVLLTLGARMLFYGKA